MAIKLRAFCSLFVMYLASSKQVDECPWERLTDPCHPLAHPDGSDITCTVEVKNCTGVPFQCRYIGACPSNECTTSYSEGSRSRRAATAYTTRYWTNGVVPYVISSMYSNTVKESILGAMRHWEDNTCIRFKQRTAEVDYVEFHNGSCCCSNIGRVGGKQYITLTIGSDWCFTMGTIVHEIGHAIGFWHEQSRPDRDEHVKVYNDNIKDGYKFNFWKQSNSSVNSYGTPYDAISVMQYPEYAHNSAWGKKTIESKYGIPLGGDELSPVDILQARRMYQCPPESKNDPPTLVPPPQDSLPPNLPDEALRCGDVLIGRIRFQNFSSPNYPQRYPENTTCGWMIHVPKGFFVELEIAYVHFDNSSLCGDHIEIYDGQSDQSTLLKKICNSSRKLYFKSSSRVVYLRFQSDSLQGNGTGFVVRFIRRDVSDCRGALRYQCWPYDCINTVGSYHCACPKGLFNPILNKQKCLDDNECMLSDFHGCSHKCINSYKSYICKCPAGMLLGSDGKTCTTDHCIAAGCQHTCTVIGSTVKCRCGPGYSLNSDQKTCRWTTVSGCWETIWNPSQVTDLTSNGFPGIITRRTHCPLFFVKPSDKREIRVTFLYFDVAGNDVCDDNKLVIRGAPEGQITLCNSTASQRIFTLRETINSLSLIVGNPQGFRGFHAKLSVI